MKKELARTIIVNGDANTYYPVVIALGQRYGFPFSSVHISRGYADPAPNTWNTATHKGGLTFTFKWTGDVSWGGNSHDYYIEDFNETYCHMVMGMQFSTNGMVVWLRGGGATYYLETDYGFSSTAIVHLGTYTDAAGTTFSPRTYNEETVKDEIIYRFIFYQPLTGTNTNRFTVRRCGVYTANWAALANTGNLYFIRK